MKQILIEDGEGKFESYKVDDFVRNKIRMLCEEEED